MAVRMIFKCRYRGTLQDQVAAALNKTPVCADKCRIFLVALGGQRKAFTGVLDVVDPNDVIGNAGAVKEALKHRSTETAPSGIAILGLSSIYGAMSASAVV